MSYLDLSIKDIHEAILNNEVTPIELVKEALERAHNDKHNSFECILDDEALEAFFTLSRLEGIIPAIESAHAVAYAMRLARTTKKTGTILVNLSGRGDKDMDYIIEKYGIDYLEKRGIKL